MRRVAISGLGRIGRTALRLLLAEPRLEVVALSDPADAEALAHLLRHDSVHGVPAFTVTAGEGCLCLLYTSPSPRDRTRSRMPSSA